MGIDAGMDLEAETVDVSATVIREADVSMTATREMADASERKTAATVRNATADRDAWQRQPQIGQTAGRKRRQKKNFRRGKLSRSRKRL